MALKLTEAQARAWDRYTAVAEEIDAQSARKTPIEVKFRQLETLFHVAHVLHIETSTEEEKNAVRNRWARLKREWIERNQGPRGKSPLSTTKAISRRTR